jgi:hypothetical protein
MLKKLKMPRKSDHRKAREAYGKLAPDTLQAVTVRLPAGLLVDLHRWADEKGMDLASAVRDLTARGLHAATLPGGLASADPRAVKKWRKRVERALRQGGSPFDPFLKDDEPEAGLAALPAILATLDYRTLFLELPESREKEAPAEERAWQQMQAEAPAHVGPLMEALDRLDRRMLARKKLYYRETSEGPVAIVHWLFAEAVMSRLGQESPDDPDVEAARQLIAARYLVAESSDRPWEFTWDE